jgi:hypothetical protein
VCSAHSCSHSVTLTGYLNSLSECIAYPVGTSCSVGSAVAVPCAPGTYNNRTAGDVCVKCAPGSFQELACQTSCNPVESISGDTCFRECVVKICFICNL